MRNRSLIIAGGLLSVLLASCATPPAERSRLDSSGVTVSTIAAVTILAHSLPAVAAGARDYAYIGPVEINNMGSRDYYLWISLASTIDREFLRLNTADTKTLLLMIDGEPMQFSVTRWRTVLDAPVYSTSAPVYATLEAQTTVDQIHRIATADSIEVHLVADTNSGARYTFWNGDWSAWRTFSETRR